MKAMFVPAFSKVKLNKDFLEAVENAVKKYKKVGLVSIVQYAPQQEVLHAYLSNRGKDVSTAYGKHSQFKGQILVCDVAAATKIRDKVDCFVYLGTGKFHPTIVAAKSGKPVLIADPLTRVVSEVSERDVHKHNVRRTIVQDKLKHARKVGILVSTKPGQANLGTARLVKSKLVEQGKKAYIFLAETLIPEDMVNFPDIEIWVNTSCAGLFDDYERFERPVINVEDVV